MADPGIELTITDRSPLWEKFTDVLFDKTEDGVWKKSVGAIMPRDVMSVSINGSDPVFYQLTTQGIYTEYDNYKMSMRAMFYNREESGELHHERELRRFGL